MQAISSLAAEFGTITIVFAVMVMLLAGFVKGAVGFAMPMIAVSGIGTFMPAELAIAAAIIPGLVTNAWQSMRGGFAEAWQSIKKYRVLCITMAIFIYLFAQLVVLIPGKTLFIILGGGITLFVSLQISGWKPRIKEVTAHRFEPLVGFLSGFFGGLTSVWGPPILFYLIARDTPKQETVRVQGITFLIGAIILTIAHRNTGLLDEISTPFSMWMVLPTLLGMFLGLKIHDKLDQKKFRRATLFVLMIAGLNLLRRGLFG